MSDKKENLKKTSRMPTLAHEGGEAKAASRTDSGATLQIGLHKPTTQSPEPVAEAAAPAERAAAPVKTEGRAPASRPLPEGFRPMPGMKAVPQKRTDHNLLMRLAEEGSYEFGQPLAMGAESMLFTGTCGNETIVIKSVRSKLNRWLGNSATRRQEIKLTKAKYSVKTRHILNEYNVGKMLFSDKEIPVVHIYAIKRHSFFFLDLGYDLIMEYLPGYDLGNYLMVQKLSVEEKIRICIQAFRALNYIHRRKLVHLDIKPSNLMYNKGVLRLFDFGITTISGTRLKTIAGTAGFLSPEQIARDVVYESTDLFAMGITLGTLFGARPLTQKLEELHTSSAKSTARYNMETNETPVLADLHELDDFPGFADILCKCTIQKRSARTQTSQAVLYQLKAWAKSPECPFDINVEW